MTTLQFQVNGLINEDQSHKLAAALADLAGVTVAAIDSRTGTVSVDTPRADLDRITGAVTFAGYELASRRTDGWGSVKRWYGRGWLAQPDLSVRPWSPAQELHRMGMLPSNG